MARPRTKKVVLTDDEIKSLKSIIRKKSTSKAIRCRCQILLDLDEAHGKMMTHAVSARANDVCIATVHITLQEPLEQSWYPYIQTLNPKICKCKSLIYINLIKHQQDTTLVEVSVKNLLENGYIRIVK